MEGSAEGVEEGADTSVAGVAVSGDAGASTRRDVRPGRPRGRAARGAAGSKSSRTSTSSPSQRRAMTVPVKFSRPASTVCST